MCRICVCVCVPRMRPSQGCSRAPQSPYTVAFMLSERKPFHGTRSIEAFNHTRLSSLRCCWCRTLHHHHHHQLLPKLSWNKRAETRARKLQQITADRPRVAAFCISSTSTIRTTTTTTDPSSTRELGQAVESFERGCTAKNKPKSKRLVNFIGFMPIAVFCSSMRNGVHNHAYYQHSQERRNICSSLRKEKTC